MLSFEMTDHGRDDIIGLRYPPRLSIAGPGHRLYDSIAVKEPGEFDKFDELEDLCTS